MNQIGRFGKDTGESSANRRIGAADFDCHDIFAVCLANGGIIKLDIVGEGQSNGAFPIFQIRRNEAINHGTAAIAPYAVYVHFSVFLITTAKGMILCKRFKRSFGFHIHEMIVTDFAFHASRVAPLFGPYPFKAKKLTVSDNGCTFNGICFHGAQFL